MTFLPPHRLVLLSAAALATVLLAAPAAQAFTFEGQASGDSAASALAPGVTPYLDPTDKLEPSQDASRFDGGGTSKYEFGGTTLQFGHQRTFNQRFNPDSLYDPLKR
jgi:hypothetical protein